MCSVSLIDRKTAKANGLAYYFTGKPCKHGHIDLRRVDSCACKTCDVLRAKAHHKANPLKANLASKKWRESKPEYQTKRLKAWKEQNAGHVQQYMQDWREKNAEGQKKYKKQWLEQNRGVKNASLARRHAAKLQRTPPWLNADDYWFMQEIYDLAVLRSKMTKISWHVDHIVPLQGKTVSGLHVPWNLRVIPAAENISKGNRFDG